MNASPKIQSCRLHDELARYCLPSAKKDANQALAWTNSICILFLLIGVLGGKRASITIRTPPPLEQIIPTIIEPAPPPPAAEQPKEEQPREQEPAEAPRVVVVTPESPAINFSVPTIGNVIAPSAMAAPPPLVPMQKLDTARNTASTIMSTGAGGDRPSPPYPKIAQEQGQQGTVILSLAVDPSGVITSISVKESSGYPILDRSTLDFVKRRWLFTPSGRARLYEAPIKFVLDASSP